MFPLTSRQSAEWFKKKKQNKTHRSQYLNRNKMSKLLSRWSGAAVEKLVSAFSTTHVNNSLLHFLSFLFFLFKWSFNYFPCGDVSTWRGFLWLEEELCSWMGTVGSLLPLLVMGGSDHVDRNEQNWTFEILYEELSGGFFAHRSLD